MATQLATLRDIPAYSLSQLYPNNVVASMALLTYVFQPTTEQGIDNNPVIAVYGSAVAITIADFNDFATGSLIFCPLLATPVVYIKTGATTWKYQAINT